MANAGWVHWDISYNNIMLYMLSKEYPAKPYSDTKSSRRRTLIDLDYAGRIQTVGENIQGSFGVRTVSYGFESSPKK